jgi:long-chain acyl-CoA synthetase
MTLDAPVEKSTLAELVANEAKTDPTRIALIFEDHAFTYAELDAEIERAADAFVSLGVRPGDRVALMFGNDPTFVFAFYAIARVGATVVPINPMYRRSETEHIVRDSEPTAALVEGSLWTREIADAFAAGGLRTVAVDGAPASQSSAITWAAARGNAQPRAPYVPLPSDLAALIYTSGTTGRAKGAMHSHATLLANCRQGWQLPRRHITADDRVLTVVPVCHIFGMQSGLNAFFNAGGSVDLMRRFHATGVLAEIERRRCTVLLGAPPMFMRWVTMPELGAHDLRSLRIVSCGAAPLKASILDTFRDVTGVSVSESYGLTEAGPTTHSNSAGPVDKMGSIGPPIVDVACRLVDADGRDVAPGEPGEIVVRTPAMMLGYWRNAQATADTIRDGWLHTGDVAVVDDDGYYTIVDRLKDMISVGGFKAWPLEIETALLDHPEIAEAAVIGVPDPDSVERPMAFVVRAAGSSLAADDVIAFAGAKLAKYKIPARVAFLDALPRLSTGKVLRRDLRELAANLEGARA